MDKFMTPRGGDNGKMIITSSKGKPRRHYQTTIASGSKVVVVEEMIRIRDQMKAAQSLDEIDLVLTKLAPHYMSLEILESTKIGITLRNLVLRCPAGQTRTRCKNVLREWKSTALIAQDRRERKAKMFQNSHTRSSEMKR